VSKAKRKALIRAIKKIKVNLDTFDLSTEQGFGSGVQLARIDIHKGGKRQTVWIDLFQHEMKRDPTIRMGVIGPHKDVTVTAQIKPWTEESE
jgi:hypothetical protein